jgi:GNAT superfamily N-acetyltransferase
MQTFVIEPLIREPIQLQRVAMWHHQECLRQGLRSDLAIRLSRLQLHLLPGIIPVTLIAYCEGSMVGCVSLVNYTYKPSDVDKSDGQPHPVWLSNLFVDTPHRNLGIGERLINAAIDYAQCNCIDGLWLSASEYTEYYEKRGWSIVRRTRLGGVKVNVMYRRVPINSSPYP